MKKVVIYGRVSTQSQEWQRQVEELRSLAKSKGWEVVKVFTEKISGAKANSERQSLTEMLDCDNGFEYLMPARESVPRHFIGKGRPRPLDLDEGYFKGKNEVLCWLLLIGCLLENKNRLKINRLTAHLCTQSLGKI